uniref:Uncharacterized protein n=1 Tax=Arundo donax TaxID=35708 RepID=A0A0A9G0H5_ARUDO
MLSATYTGSFRQELQKKYHLKNSPCDHLPGPLLSALVRQLSGAP